MEEASGKGEVHRKNNHIKLFLRLNFLPFQKKRKVGVETLKKNIRICNKNSTLWFFFNLAFFFVLKKRF